MICRCLWLWHPARDLMEQQGRPARIPRAYPNCHHIRTHASARDPRCCHARQAFGAAQSTRHLGKSAAIRPLQDLTPSPGAWRRLADRSTAPKCPAAAGAAAPTAACTCPAPRTQRALPQRRRRRPASGARLRCLRRSAARAGGKPTASPVSTRASHAPRRRADAGWTAVPAASNRFGCRLQRSAHALSRPCHPCPPHNPPPLLLAPNSAPHAHQEG